MDSLAEIMARVERLAFAQEQGFCRKVAFSRVLGSVSH
jgi:hypothetical protein